MSKMKILVLVIFSLLLASILAIPSQDSGSEDDGGRYIGPGGCRFCHQQYYDEWLLTNHSRAFQILVDVKQDKNETCIPCHVTGYDNNTKTYKFRDVTCEACHNSGDISNSITERVLEQVYKNNKSALEIKSLLAEMNLNKKSMDKNLTSEMCGRCHQGEEHPTYEEWNKSKHSQSLVDLKNDKDAKDECLKCHSTEYIEADEYNKPTLNEVTIGLTCQACHDVHNSKVEKLLRMPKNRLCVSCHNMQGAKPGETPYQSQSEMRLSYGGVDADTYIYQPNAACADCHRYTREYNETGINESAITGHTFEIDFDVCLTCHQGFPTAQEAEKFVKNQQKEIMDGYYNTIMKVYDAGNITVGINGEQKSVYEHAYIEALFNIQMVSADKSKGAHNPKYAKELIDKADLKASNIISGRPEAKVQGIPGFELLQGFAALLFMILVLLKRQKD